VEKVVREVRELYDAISKGRGSPLQELGIQYADYAYWQRQYLAGDMLKNHLAYWKRQLAGKLPTLDLPVDHPRPAAFRYRGVAKSFSLPGELDQSLRELSRREGVTLSIVFLAAFKTLLYRYTAQEDIIVATATANRIPTEVTPLIGPFVNTLPLRTNLGGNPRFRELLRRVKDVTLVRYLYQDLPFEKLLEEMKPESAAKELSMFNVAFGLQNARWEDLSINGIKIKLLDAEKGIGRFDLGLSVTEGHEVMQVCWAYRKDLFEEGTIIRMHNHFETLLFNIIDRPDTRILSIKVSSRTKSRLNNKEQNDLEDTNRRRLRTIKRKGVNLPTDHA